MHNVFCRNPCRRNLLFWTESSGICQLQKDAEDWSKFFHRNNGLNLGKFFLSLHADIQRPLLQKLSNPAYHHKQRIGHFDNSGHCLYDNKAKEFVVLLTFLEKGCVKVLPKKNRNAWKTFFSAMYVSIQRPSLQKLLNSCTLLKKVHHLWFLTYKWKCVPTKLV